MKRHLATLATLATLAAALTLSAAPPAITPSVSTVSITTPGTVAFPADRQLVQTFDNSTLSTTTPLGNGTLGLNTDTGVLYLGSGSPPGPGDWSINGDEWRQAIGIDQYFLRAQQDVGQYITAYQHGDGTVVQIVSEDTGGTPVLVNLNKLAALPPLNTIALLTSIQTLTNKTISGASNTLSAIPLGTAVTGTLPIANGGTGSTSLPSVTHYTPAAATLSGHLSGIDTALASVVSLSQSPAWTGAHIFSKNGALSSPTITLTGTPVTGGSATTTKPLFLLEPSGTTSTGWNTAGTLLGINAPTGFTGDLQWWGENGTRYGRWFEFAGVYPSFGISAPGGGNEIYWYNAYGSLTLHAATSFAVNSTQSAGQSVITCNNANGVTAYWHLATTGAASQIQLGVSSSSPTDYVLFGTAATGTNIAGGDLTLSGGRNTGNAAGGAIILATAPAGSSGSTPGSPIARLTIDTDGHIIAASLPTSATGLASGTLWNDSGTLKVAP